MAGRYLITDCRRKGLGKGVENKVLALQCVCVCDISESARNTDAVSLLRRLENQAPVSRDSEELVRCTTGTTGLGK